MTKEKDKDEEGVDGDIESNVDETMIDGQRKAKKKKDTSKAATDDDGYMTFSMPWSLTSGYGITMRENTSGTSSIQVVCVILISLRRLLTSVETFCISEG